MPTTGPGRESKVQCALDYTGMFTMIGCWRVDVSMPGAMDVHTTRDWREAEHDGARQATNVCASGLQSRVLLGSGNGRAIVMVVVL